MSEIEDRGRNQQLWNNIIRQLSVRIVTVTTGDRVGKRSQIDAKVIVHK